MPQNNEKLFKPEDFDKNKSSKNGTGWKKPLGIIAFIAVFGGISYGAYSLLNNNTSPTDTKVAVVTDGETHPIEDNVVRELDQTNKDSTEVEEIRVQPAEGSQPETDEFKETEGVKPKVKETPVISREGSNIVPLTGTLEEKAKRVIRGEFGNGQVRKDKLGDEYAEIQAKVNEIYREKGLIH